jgi:hypothetical protein
MSGDTWEKFRDARLAHMRGTIGFDERAAMWRLWDEWRSREATRITREALAASRPTPAPETRAERILRCSREDAAGSVWGTHDRRTGIGPRIGIGPAPAPREIATEPQIAAALARANGSPVMAAYLLDHEGLIAMRGAL